MLINLLEEVLFILDVYRKKLCLLIILKCIHLRCFVKLWGRIKLFSLLGIRSILRIRGMGGLRSLMAKRKMLNISMIRKIGPRSIYRLLMQFTSLMKNIQWNFLLISSIVNFLRLLSALMEVELNKIESYQEIGDVGLSMALLSLNFLSNGWQAPWLVNSWYMYPLEQRIK